MKYQIKNAGTLAFAALLATTAALSVAGSANAQPHKQKVAATTVTEQAPAGDPIDAAIRASDGTNFAIVSQAQLSSGMSADIRLNTSADELKGIRASIAANPALASQITGRNIEIKEITGARKALDGSLVLYTM